MMWHTYDGMGWWMVFGAIVWILSIAALIWLATWAIGTARRQEPRSRADALEIARQRFARGEISAEEFQRIRDTLEHRGGTPAPPAGAG